MPELLSLPVTADRKALYDAVVPQIDSLVSGETNLIANLANIAAVLKESFGFLWVGFYLTNEGQLVLGPFQGPLACTRIDFDSGVCGHAYMTKETTIVPDVDKFPGHIACSSAAKSEIVVPIFAQDNEVFGVLDADSGARDDFSQVDTDGLERVVKIIERSLKI